MALDDYTTGVLGKLRLDASNRPFYTPALMAYLRGVGMSLSQAEDTRARSRGEAQTDYQSQMDSAQRDYETGRRNTTSSLVSRGVLRSGESDRRYTEQDQANARRQNDIEAAKSNRLTAVDRAYQGVEDSLRQQTTERLLQAEQEDADRKAVQDAQMRQQQQLLDFYKGKKNG